MTRAELLQRPREREPRLESRGGVDLRLFGAWTRDEARGDRDLALTRRIVRLMRLEVFAGPIKPPQKLGREVELFQDGELRRFARRTGRRSSSEGETGLVEIVGEAIRRILPYATGLTPGGLLEGLRTTDAATLKPAVLGEHAHPPPPSVKLRSIRLWTENAALRHHLARACACTRPRLLRRAAQDGWPELAREFAAWEGR